MVILNINKLISPLETAFAGGVIS